MTSFIKGLEDDCEQNKCLSEEVDSNYEINYDDDDDDDDDLVNNHYLSLSMPPNEVERRRAFYAGVPLRTDDDSTICVIDREPRDSFSKKDRESLKEFAKVVVRELEL
ncbi:Tco6 SGD histidine kinase sensor protein [Rhizophagus irregularis DAOM 181602=DAOM 197198]|uniref:GAF domain-containing protein n=1 Tax=Rhizophagus irregularis (strain DAOM 181602 / DAOM 197198 / MUCL 43194) TaxID=747089 RepID=A0A2P4P383_RHIID|nr:hypothetical protein GLOIN_2v1884742 [Rhizophagus irregularis DAOM 181602=DAOM 197198]POG59842.1 hypothetical protein GLOIN_2v1884742 [Rhizophagus irregularis DAOM 181602=DAOM 197198]GBC18096.2 Tco6 SGD histidine kinase sensor protein [Rhizophagus irregularis DAOM 181602=DAOM 197198]|eukprot:XP_025166708.1 hypothetical protein GLOIN_2v1884742 [Rhizophagus irregularis DAOM 181602=DAOM 197198]